MSNVITRMDVARRDYEAHCGPMLPNKPSEWEFLPLSERAAWFDRAELPKAMPPRTHYTPLSVMVKNIVCNCAFHGCTAKFSAPDYSLNARAEAAAQFKREGWVRRGKKGYCPNHKPTRRTK